VTVACYAHVSTADQQLDRQIESITDYAQNRLSASLQDVDIYRDKSTGTDTNRSGYQALMDTADAGNIDAVIIHQVTRIARSVSDLESRLTPSIRTI
jgi:DNA invertase Pin-like site-specific DNA recombinase